MLSKTNKQVIEYKGKREGSPLKSKSCEDKKLLKNKENDIICMTYKLDKNLFEYNKYIRLFGEDFTKINNNKCYIIIDGKKYEITSTIDIEEFEKYGFNEKDETLKVILKNETVEDMSYLFFGCKSLVKVNFSSFNSKNVTCLGAMFAGCESLIDVDLSSFNTQNVKSMAGMFSSCENLTKIDLSSFNTQNLTSARYMFYGCTNLTEIDLSSFNTQNLINVSYMFSCCDSLTKVDLSSFNTQNITDMSYMFNRCEELTKLDLSTFNTQNVTNM